MKGVHWDDTKVSFCVSSLWGLGGGKPESGHFYGVGIMVVCQSHGHFLDSHSYRAASEERHFA